MEPHTARNLKERKDNKLKDFLHVAGPLGAPSCAPPATLPPLRPRRGPAPLLRFAAR